MKDSAPEAGSVLREWRGVTPTAAKAAYISYLQRTGLGDYAATEGNRGVLLLARDLGSGRTEFTTLSLWRDIDAIRAYAGERPERARYYPRDGDFLEELVPEVSHHRVHYLEGFRFK
jgi:heme-degrading monooxygenase HmoA